MPLTFLPFLLLIVPIMEIGVFIVVGGNIGALWTIGLVLFTAVLGSILLRIEGFRTFVQIREKMNTGQIPGEELAKGAMILIAGVLLLTPGFITDGVGFVLFVPFVRKLIWVFLTNRFTVRGIGGLGASEFSNQKSGFSDHDVDGNIVDLDPEDFYEDPNSKSPWYSESDDRRRG